MGTLTGKVAAITGGASGIGEAAVRRFVAEGGKVAFADLDGERGRRVAADIEGNGGAVTFTEADVADEAAAMTFVQQAEGHFGQLDILVNNAGIRMYQTVVDATAETLVLIPWTWPSSR